MDENQKRRNLIAYHNQILNANIKILQSLKYNSIKENLDQRKIQLEKMQIEINNLNKIIS